MNEEQKTQYWKQLTKYISGEMNQEEKTLFENWAEKADGKKLLNDMEKDMHTVDKNGYMYNEETNRAWESFNKRLNLEETEKVEIRQLPVFNIQFIARVAAMLVIAAGLSWGILSIVDYSKKGVLQTEYSQSQTILSDGSVVYLNANSELVYPKSFKGDTRTVQLKGEAYFDIQSNPEKPFIIEVNNAKVEVLGTSFNVLSNEENSEVEVFVESGKVKVSTLDDDNVILLEKGDFGMINTEGSYHIPIKELNYLSWKTKRIDFRDEDINSVISVLNKTYGVNIQLETVDTESMRLTSRYDDVELDTILESICIAFNLHKTYSGENILLTFANQ